jgi:outer membrane receptor protein involved in Fe transport
VLYGTDALSGTINIITNRARLTETDKPVMTAGFDGLYSSNENGHRGTVSLGLANRHVEKTSQQRRAQLELSTVGRTNQPELTKASHCPFPRRARQRLEA